MLEAAADRMYRLARAAAILAGLLVLIASVVVFIDVLLRSVAGRTLGGADELSGYALAISTAWALPYCLLGKHNIRVDTLHRLAPAQVRAFMDILGLLAIGAFVLLLTYRAGLVLFETIGRNSRSVGPLSLPQIYPQSLWLAGLVFTALAFLLIAVRSVVAVVNGNLQQVETIAGTKDSAATDIT